MCAVASAAGPHPSVEDGTRLLILGNSLFSFFGPLNEVFRILCADADPRIDITMIGDGKGGAVLSDFVYGNADDPTLLERVNAKIDTGGFDYVILCGYLDAMGEWPESMGSHAVYYDNVRILDARIRAGGGTTLLHMVHPPWMDFRRRLWGIQSANDSMAAELGSYVIPIGTVFDSARAAFDIPPLITDKSNPDYNGDYYPIEYQDGPDYYIKLLYHDFVHQNGNGMALMAYAYYTFFTGLEADPITDISRYPGGGISDGWRQDIQQQLADIAYGVVTRYQAGYRVSNPLNPLMVPEWLVTAAQRKRSAVRVPLPNAPAVNCAYTIDGRRVERVDTNLPAAVLVKVDKQRHRCRVACSGQRSRE
jgi:hypothetical protein